ncbi:MAG: DUF268 domain-containing protein [Chloroflexi bacterium]|nr:DUF268 domain-containing protein [Chloroflexota bacterium]
MSLSPAMWMLKRVVKDALRAIRSVPSEIAAWRRFWHTYQAYNALAPGETKVTTDHLLPCIHDATAQTDIEPIYFYQDAWAFEKIVQLQPTHHVDIGSHHKFVALLSKVVPVTMVDIRPLSLRLDSLKFQEGSILALPFGDRELSSVSSLCVVEHIGLGRYGDPLDPHGTEKAIRELKRVVAPGGSLVISLPIDDSNRVFFNAHRAFREDYLLRLFDPFQVLEAHYIYGMTFGTARQSGFGIGCYYLRG